jgi:hypothetical protein
MAVSFVPSIAPNGQDQTVYLVINNSSRPPRWASVDVLVTPVRGADRTT